MYKNIIWDFDVHFLTATRPSLERFSPPCLTMAQTAIY